VPIKTAAFSSSLPRLQTNFANLSKIQTSAPYEFYSRGQVLCLPISTYMARAEYFYRKRFLAKLSEQSLARVKKNKQLSKNFPLTDLSVGSMKK